MRRHRDRRRSGRCCVTAELLRGEVARFVQLGFVPQDQSGNPQAIRDGLHSFLDEAMRVVGRTSAEWHQSIDALLRDGLEAWDVERDGPYPWLKATWVPREVAAIYRRNPRYFELVEEWKTRRSSPAS